MAINLISNSVYVLKGNCSPAVFALPDVQTTLPTIHAGVFVEHPTNLINVGDTITISMPDGTSAVMVAVSVLSVPNVQNEFLVLGTLNATIDSMIQRLSSISPFFDFFTQTSVTPNILVSQNQNNVSPFNFWYGSQYNLSITHNSPNPAFQYVINTASSLNLRKNYAIIAQFIIFDNCNVSCWRFLPNELTALPEPQNANACTLPDSYNATFDYSPIANIALDDYEPIDCVFLNGMSGNQVGVILGNNKNVMRIARIQLYETYFGNGSNTNSHELTTFAFLLPFALDMVQMQYLYHLQGELGDLGIQTLAGLALASGFLTNLPTYNSFVLPNDRLDVGLYVCLDSCLTLSFIAINSSLPIKVRVEGATLAGVPLASPLTYDLTNVFLDTPIVFSGCVQLYTFLFTLSRVIGQSPVSFDSFTTIAFSSGTFGHYVSYSYEKSVCCGSCVATLAFINNFGVVDTIHVNCTFEKDEVEDSEFFCEDSDCHFYDTDSNTTIADIKVLGTSRYGELAIAKKAKTKVTLTTFCKITSGQNKTASNNVINAVLRAKQHYLLYDGRWWGANLENSTFEFDAEPPYEFTFTLSKPVKIA